MPVPPMDKTEEMVRLELEDKRIPSATICRCRTGTSSGSLIKPLWVIVNSKDLLLLFLRQVVQKFTRLEYVAMLEFSREGLKPNLSSTTTIVRLHLMRCSDSNLCLGALRPVLVSPSRVLCSCAHLFVLRVDRPPSSVRLEAMQQAEVIYCRKDE
ncbi:uncharacterized protein LOC124678938 isoform X2 [Lolium rigidum]|uniref:uncharacterized protein LOC124678938 isoform X2 n=1 Tax=Lolium rigidum TaxID=89674 RepID=UPI001F5C85D9|nr:uncharacterized protein LOC124678938 isoform X2 [Lolium rigidum]